MTDVATFDLAGFKGPVLRPDDDGYDEARKVFNGMIDRRPAIIGRCTDADDVVVLVNLAGENHLPISIYGGGHGVTGSAVVDAGICADMRGMKGITLDPEARTVRAEAGLTWGEFDTGGRVSAGIAGRGQRQSVAERTLGFVCDNMVAAEVVTADGRKVMASDDENAPVLGPAGCGGSVRPAGGALEHQLPVDLAGSGRQREEHRLHPGHRHRHEAVDDRAGVPELHRRRGVGSGGRPHTGPSATPGCGAQGHVGPHNVFRHNQNNRPGDLRNGPVWGCCCCCWC